VGYQATESRVRELNPRRLSRLFVLNAFEFVHVHQHVCDFGLHFVDSLRVAALEMVIEVSLHFLGAHEDVIDDAVGGVWKFFCGAAFSAFLRCACIRPLSWECR